MRSTLPAAILVTFVTVASSAAREEPAAGATSPPASVSGQLAFSETIVFDYDRDGTPDRVQFWIELEGLQAIGAKDEPGARDEAGSVSYFVYDVERQRRIDDWLLGFNMSEGFPVAGQAYPLTDIRITGRTAQFDLRGSTWTITDGGGSWEKDSIEIQTGGRKRQGRFYGGDLTVTPGPPVPPRPPAVATAGAAPQVGAAGRDARAAQATATPAPAAVGTAGPPPPGSAEVYGAGTAQVARELLPPADIKENRRCNKCHLEAARTMATDGGPHSELECASCHTKHPRFDAGAVPQCPACHNSHDQSMRISSCRTCHSGHDIEAIRHGIEIPDEHCAACHKKSASRLRESGTRHMGLACVICHRSSHGAVPACTDCHGGPHSKRVMSKPERCVKCHSSAHETEVDR